MAYDFEHAQQLKNAYLKLDKETKANNIIYITITHGDDDFLY